MKVITIRRVDLQFDADQVTHGTAEQQADQAIEHINLTLKRQPFGLGAQLIVHRDEIEIETHNQES
jgi:polyisoprenoid-binding protein YceI